MSGRLRRRTGALGALIAATLAGSCNQSGKGLPPLPEFADAQRAAWQKAPADALGGVVIADVGHLLGRLRALRAVISTGPVTKGYVDRGMAAATMALGFDPLDDAGWRKAGLDPTGPLAIFLGPSNTGQIVFRASDATAAEQTALAWRKLSDNTDPFGCGAAGALYRCGSPGWKLPDDASHSLWPHVEKNLPAPERAMELVGYAPLDQGEMKAALDKDESRPFRAMHAGYGAMTIAPERIVLHGGATADDFAKYASYFTPRPGPSLIGLASDSLSAGRMTFSPDVVWAKLQQELGKLGAPEAGVFNAVAGFDLDKDVVQNLTGEIVYAGFRSDARRSPDGGHRTYVDRLGWAAVVGTRDDASTRKVADRLGELIGGAIGSFGASAEALGFKMAYRSEGKDRKVHWLDIDVDAEKAKVLGTTRLEVFLTSVPGGIAVGIGPVGVEELRLRAGRKPSAMLDRLPLPEEREAFQHSPMVFWGKIGEDFAFKDLGRKVADAGMPAEVASVMTETLAVFQLVYEGMFAATWSPDRVEISYHLSLL